MNVLFLTLYKFNSIMEHNLYTDLLREFVKNGHQVFAVSPIERKEKRKTYLVEEKGVRILRLKIGNTQKTNIIEKGISTIMMENIFIRGLEKYFFSVKFDLVLYSTPPITLVGAIEYIKTRDGAKTYLLLKDIFPQNSVDLGLLSKKGIKGWLYYFFKIKEKKLYEISDYIGCMSMANKKYLLENNNEICSSKVEICPNSVEPIDLSVSEEQKVILRKKYELPLDKIIYVYGGNLGRPQGIDYIIECLKTCKNNNVFFLIIGNGTEYNKLNAYMESCRPNHVKLLKELPKDEYDSLIGSCDVGMIFLDYRFTIPNFPSRILSYMQARLPILVASDKNTDIGLIVEENKFGYWCESNRVENFIRLINKYDSQRDRKIMGENSFSYLVQNYSANHAFDIILGQLRQNRGIK